MPRRIGWKRKDIGREDREAAKLWDKVIEAEEQKQRKRERQADMTRVERVADDHAIDIRLQCPVCRGLQDCECEEEDRSFVRRVRFEQNVNKVPRCRRCRAPLSVVYVRHPGATKPPFRLAQFEAVFSCAICSPAALATVLMAETRTQSGQNKVDGGAGSLPTVIP